MFFYQCSIEQIYIKLIFHHVFFSHLLECVKTPYNQILLNGRLLVYIHEKLQNMFEDIISLLDFYSLNKQQY